MFVHVQPFLVVDFVLYIGHFQVFQVHICIFSSMYTVFLSCKFCFVYRSLPDILGIFSSMYIVNSGLILYHLFTIYMYIYLYIHVGVDVVEWSRALDVRLSEWCCSVTMVWVQIPSREEQKFDSSKI
jgi:hypothetical protein